MKCRFLQVINESVYCDLIQEFLFVVSINDMIFYDDINLNNNNIIIIIIIIIIRAFCLRAGSSLQAQEPRLKFCRR